MTQGKKENHIKNLITYLSKVKLQKRKALHLNGIKNKDSSGKKIRKKTKKKQ